VAAGTRAAGREVRLRWSGGAYRVARRRPTTWVLRDPPHCAPVPTLARLRPRRGAMPVRHCLFARLRFVAFVIGSVASASVWSQSARALADFGAQRPSPEVRHVANWALETGDSGGRALIIVDKQYARVFVLDAAGRLQGVSPALLGSARGDHTAPGVGDKPLSQIRPDERTTPAGRFMARPGFNAQGEDIVWVDYPSAVSMHRVRARGASRRPRGSRPIRCRRPAH